jgi:hypothetical protein
MQYKKLEFHKSTTFHVATVSSNGKKKIRTDKWIK